MKRLAVLGLWWLFVPLLGAWAVLALHYSNLPWPWLRTTLAVAFAACFLVAFARPRWRKKARRLFLPVVVLIGIWFFSIPPKTEAQYPPEMTRMPRVELSGDMVSVRGVRNFHYRTEEDFDERFEDRSYDLRKVHCVDFFVSYWDGRKDVGHTFLSFGFEGDEYLAISIEIRRETDEEYEVVKGVFKQYELIYVCADERDVVRLRTNVRGEDVYLYRTNCDPECSRKLLVEMLMVIEELAEEPRFYNTLTQNCTSCLIDHINAALPTKLPFYKRRIRNGYSDRQAFDEGWIESDAGFEKTRRRARINERARGADQAPDFSSRIRTHLKPR